MKGFARAASARRSRRRAAVLMVTLGAALVVAAGALAWHGFSSASSVTATFTAGIVANSQSSTCTASNNDSIQATEATFTGTATSGDSHLNGPITINATSVYDTTTNAGTVSGSVSINGGSGSGFEGRLLAVDVNGQLQGLLVGDESGAGPLIGNVSSVFSTTSGFGTGSIGTGTGTNTAIVSTSSCQPQAPGHGMGNFGGHGNFKGLGQFANIGNEFFGAGGRHDRH
jgi:hypothetical protein